MVLLVGIECFIRYKLMKQKPSEIFEKSWEKDLIKRGVLSKETEKVEYHEIRMKRPDGTIESFTPQINKVKPEGVGEWEEIFARDYFNNDSWDMRNYWKVVEFIRQLLSQEKAKWNSELREMIGKMMPEPEDFLSEKDPYMFGLLRDAQADRCRLLNEVIDKIENPS